MSKIKPTKNQLIYKSIESIIPYQKNSRKHQPEQIEKIVNSIKEFGFINPIIINGEIIVAGHARYEAAKKIGMKELPTLDISHLSKNQIQAYVIADNRLAEHSSWDNEILTAELNELFSQDFDISLTGWDTLNPFEDKVKPEKETLEYKEILAVYIECQSEEEQKQVFNLLKKEGFKCKILSM